MAVGMLFVWFTRGDADDDEPKHVVEGVYGRVQRVPKNREGTRHHADRGFGDQHRHVGDEKTCEYAAHRGGAV
jgi:hypothetical protein